MSTSNYIKNVAVVGASGNSGSHMVKELLATGKHTVTAISRVDSKNKLPEGVQVARVDYSKFDTLVEALKGQDALVITLSTVADHSQQGELIKAAAKAGVSWIMPNDWAPDTHHEGLVKDVFAFQDMVKTRKMIEDTPGVSHLSVSTGFWYEWSLSIPNSYGFDLVNREVTFFDNGETKISTSTWPQVGRAVAAILSMPIDPEGSAKACLEDFRNKTFYINSFTVSQRDMFESALRVTGTKESDWKITKEPAKERYDAGLKAFQNGDRRGFVKVMYTRVFYPDGNGDFEMNRGVANELLGLPKESLDEATKVAVQRAIDIPGGYSVST
ncbi:hypothetical protein AC579_1378 [Pseudocercospora musae]|uniref:NAD(P)-binding domain-containing protein n=1 Tax=Pseudocercospora musae TaxID=113226 RepID=A0A139IKB7_9PEZI|nr:hypothetical protein AC579_1378 [Pseudocercospora musae]